MNRAWPYNRNISSNKRHTKKKHHTKKTRTKKQTNKKYNNKKQQSEEEVVDHLPALKAECKKHCPAQQKEYNACKDRIAKLGEGDCEAWYFDLLHCVDHCVAPQAFKKLK
jgi:ubiquinol-cytochrome c reductase subunit 6